MDEEIKTLISELVWELKERRRVEESQLRDLNDNLRHIKQELEQTNKNVESLGLNVLQLTDEFRMEKINAERRERGE